ncbi:hypothetical protein BGZ80_007851 [Entomortierella chlamydospora]|uniref:F-box domain-containing protein n=1 Tax=Entomortierella chlamydospora TaxID=101097 RepID=A0A9P6N4N1_9FUNG|nr:hypothetical protein BGZ80_007851 [Entomortierella chlamydospora]
MEETLGIPEMRTIIAQFLALKDLLVCTLLSKAWNETCSPLIWRKVLIGGSKIPSLSAMKKHGQYIRVLLLENTKGIEPLLAHCNHLTVLKLLTFLDEEEDDDDDDDDDDDKDGYSDEFIQFLARNQATLRVFENHWSEPEIPKEALVILLSCPNLEELVTTGVTYDDVTWELLVKAGCRLSKLISIDDTITSQALAAPPPPSLRWETITTLSFQYPHVDDEPGFVVDCIKRCPQLRSLIWDSKASFPIKAFVEQVLPACPKLDSLSIQNFGIEDADISKVLEAMNQLRLVKIRGICDDTGTATPGLKIFGAIRKHFSTLESIYFRAAYHIKSEYVAEILESCPSLRLVEALDINADHIHDTPVWACTGLRIFRVCIVGVKSDNSHRVFKQLGRLRQLYELDIHPEGNKVTDGLNLTQKAGLGAMEGLKELRFVSTMSVMQTLDKDDVDWITKFWKNLRVWEGQPHHDKDKLLTIEKEFRKHGILIVRFLVPSPNVESSLPVYTHSPPVPSAPPVLHTPNRSDAQPLTSAIKTHSSITKGEDDKIPSKGTRFADPEDSPPPGQEEHQPRNRNVTFQTRPRADTAESSNSVVFPTFAAYRQAQSNKTMDAFAKRVKKAFVLSQQQQEQARIEEILRRQQAEEEEEERQLRELEEQQQQQQQRQQQDIPMPTTRQRSSSNALPMSSPSVPAGGNRLRSSSAASMFSDIAERIRNGTLFKISSNNTSTAVADMNDKQSEQSSRVGGGENGESELGGLLGIEILVTSPENDHPITDDDAAASTSIGHVRIDTDTEK